MVVKVPADALRPVCGTPATQQLADFCLELRLSSWQLRRAVRAGQALRPASLKRSVGPLPVLTVSSAGAGMGTGRQVSKCAKTCFCTSARLEGCSNVDLAPSGFVLSFGALCLCIALAPTSPKVAAVPRGTLVTKVVSG